jgi:hypothetical protein
MSHSKEKEPAAPPTNGIERISSEELAVLVVDALLHAEIVKQDDVRRAIRIAAEEIEVRKAMGDY